MRIVVDTNVFISACIGRGDASKVIEACIEGKAVPLIGKTLFLKYEDVIGRPDIFRRARLNATKRDTLFDILLGKCDRPDVSSSGARTSAMNPIITSWIWQLRDKLVLSSPATCVISKALN